MQRTISISCEYHTLFARVVTFALNVNKSFSVLVTQYTIVENFLLPRELPVEKLGLRGGVETYGTRGSARCTGGINGNWLEPYFVSQLRQQLPSILVCQADAIHSPLYYDVIPL